MVLINQWLISAFGRTWDKFSMLRVCLPHTVAESGDLWYCTSQTKSALHARVNRTYSGAFCPLEAKSNFTEKFALYLSSIAGQACNAQEGTLL